MPATFEQIRDDAVNASSAAHARIKQEQAIFNNDGAYDATTQVGRVYSSAGESLNPKASEGILKIKPAYESNQVRIDIQADRGTRFTDDVDLVDDLSDWCDMMEDIGGEDEQAKSSIHHNSVGGTAVRKIYYDPIRKVVLASEIDPTTFSPDPKCTDIGLYGANYVVQTSFENTDYIEKYYPNYVITDRTRKDARGQSHRIDEMWMRREFAEDMGVDVSSTQKRIIKCVLVDDQLVQLRESPYNWPDFPFSCWRNMIDYRANGRTQEFWGFGYSTLLWPQQKMLDHLLANLVLIVNNQAVGRFLSKEGAIDTEQVLPIHGLNIQVRPPFTLQDIQHLPPDQIPPVLFQFVSYIADVMTGMIPSLSPVFTGEAPFSGASGKAVNSLQFAAFTQASSNTKAMNEFRAKTKRIRINLIQQFARKPMEPYRWREGLDLPDRFPEDARYIGFNLHIPDSSSIPNNPATRFEIFRMLREMGMVMPNDRALEFLGLDKAFGLKADNFIQQVQGVGAQPNIEALLGQAGAGVGE